MMKVKRLRTADCVVGGFRNESDSDKVGSLLLGLYNDAGELDHVGYTSTISDDERPALTKKLEGLRELPGFTGKAPGGPSRWSTERSGEWEPLRPELVVEVRFDHVTYNEAMVDRVTLIAAGATYFIVLALFPGLGVLVSVYGFLSDPSDIGEQMGFVGSFLPSGAYDLLLPQLEALSSKGRSQLTFAFALSLLLAFWSAMSGVKALFDAMNVAYGENEKRSIVRLNLMAFGFTLGAIVVVVVLIALIGIIPLVLKVLYLDQWAELLARLARWPFVLLLSGCATMIVYRYGPSRENAKLRWLTWGAALSTVTWAITTVAFSVYLLNFATYNATYGTLGALVAFMVWIWLSIIILIVGAELNAGYCQVV